MLKFPLWNNFCCPVRREKKKKNTCNRMGGEKDRLGLHTQRGKSHAGPCLGRKGADRKGIHTQRRIPRQILWSPVTSEKEKKAVICRRAQINAWKTLMSLKHLLPRGNISEVLKVAATNWASGGLRGYKSLSLHKLCIKMVNRFYCSQRG